MNNNIFKSLDENRAYQQGYQFGRAGASRAQWEVAKKMLPARLQKVFVLGRTDGWLDSIKEGRK